MKKETLRRARFLSVAWKSLLLLLLFLGTQSLSAELYAQASRKVTGTVTDGKGESIPGVNVLVRGTATGAITDLDGNYVITVPDAKSVLQFTFVGYQTQEIPVGNQKSIQVKLIDDAQALDDPEMMVPRNSYEECVTFITTEFQRAAGLLPDENRGSNFGRVTKGAALAMKSRMLLYAASPLWNPTNDVKKWEEAATAAEAVMAFGYKLDPDYKGLFLNPKSTEIIFQRLYNSEYGHWFDWENTPNGWKGYSATCVLQNMVDSYEMLDGTLPDPAKYATATSDPWLGRDPRFYASVVCDGQTFRDGTVDFYVYEDGKWGGSDSELGTNAWNYAKTYYTIRKFMDESLNGIWSDKGKQPWIYCRLGEIYLNYAEAKFHCGDEITARKYVNYVRERARGGKTGIVPDITETGSALLARIQHERKIELAFEEHRFFDVRRWKIAERTENFEAQGIKVTLMEDGTKRYKIQKVQDRKFVTPNHYLLPISRTEIERNSQLVQNPGYDERQ